MATNGEKLKAARLKQGKSIQDIAELTRISSVFLEALEENQLDKIPGIFFRRSFLKQYASTLGLNPDEFQLDEAMEFRSLGGDESGTAFGVRLHEQPDLPPLPPAGRRRSVPFRQVFLSIGLLIGVLALCAVAYTLWEDYQIGRDRQQAVLDDPIAPPFPAMEPAADPTVNTGEPEPSTSAETPETTSSPQAQSTAPTTATPAAAPVTPATPPRATTESPAEGEAAPRTTYGEGSRELRLSASAPAWVQVQEGDKTVYTGVIQPGQSRVIRVTDGARLVVGNAGGLNLAWQGKTMEPVGPLGQVRIVNVTLDGVTVAAPQKREQSEQQDNT